MLGPSAIMSKAAGRGDSPKQLLYYDDEPAPFPSAPAIASGSTPANLQSALTELERSLDLVTRVDALVGENTTLQQQNRRLNASLDSAKRENESLTAECAALHERVKASEKEASEAKSDIASLREQLRLRDADLQAKAKEASRLTDELARLQLQLRPPRTGPPAGGNTVAAVEDQTGDLDLSDDPYPEARPRGGIPAPLYQYGSAQEAFQSAIHPYTGGAAMSGRAAARAAQAQGTRSPVRDAVNVMEAASSMQSLRDSLKGMESAVSDLNRRSCARNYGLASDSVSPHGPPHYHSTLTMGLTADDFPSYAAAAPQHNFNYSYGAEPGYAVPSLASSAAEPLWAPREYPGGPAARGGARGAGHSALTFSIDSIAPPAGTAASFYDSEAAAEPPSYAGPGSGQAPGPRPGSPDFDSALESIRERARQAVLEASVAARTLEEAMGLPPRVQAGGGGGAGGAGGGEDARAQPAPWRPAGPASPPRNPYSYNHAGPGGSGAGRKPPRREGPAGFPLGAAGPVTEDQGFAPIASSVLRPDYIQRAYLGGGVH